MSDNAEEPADLKKIRDAVHLLGEHFDSVRIFATRHESGERDGTLKFNYGAGNWFATYGQVREWLILADEDARIYARKSFKADGGENA